MKYLNLLKNGNFLGLLELLAQFDDFLADYIHRFGNSGRGVASYLFSTICNEFVAKEVTTKIVNEVKKAKHYSITVDSTPDVTSDGYSKLGAPNK